MSSDEAAAIENLERKLNVLLKGEMAGTPKRKIRQGGMIPTLDITVNRCKIHSFRLIDAVWNG